MKSLILTVIFTVLLRFITSAQPSVINHSYNQKNQFVSKDSAAYYTGDGKIIPGFTGEREAKFPGGSAGWKRYLETHLNAGVVQNVKTPVGRYTVKVRFLVDKEGNIGDVKADSVLPACPDCSTEAVRVIKKGPKWLPAIQFGKPVNYKAVQYITFQARDTITGRLPVAGPPLVKFENISLKEALKKAAETNRIIFAQFESSFCSRCNEVADVALASKALADLVNERCIPIKINNDYADRNDFIQKYNPSQQIGTYFIGGDEDLLSHFAITTTSDKQYIAEVEKALSKQIEGRVTMKELDDEWKTEPSNFTAMELNLERRRSFGWTTDTLLETYVARLPADSFQSPRVLAIIADNAPSIYSRASYVLRHDQTLFNQLWKSLPLSRRININNRIISKSLATAIKFRIKSMAERVAQFTAQTYDGEGPVKAQQGYDKQMLLFYRGIHDTAAYLQKAIAYYDKYFMSVNAEDILKIDSINRKNALDTARMVSVEDEKNKGRFINKRTIAVIPQGLVISGELLQAAQLVYSSANNAEYLQKAIAWAKHAKELFMFADVSDVYARLLYVTGDKEQAAAVQKEVIQKLKERNMSYKQEQFHLQQMEANQKMTDRLPY